MDEELRIQVIAAIEFALELADPKRFTKANKIDIEHVLMEVKNLTIPVVNCPREQLKDKQKPIFEDWVKDTYIKESDNTYVHKEYKFKKDGHQVRNIYNLLFQNL